MADQQRPRPPEPVVLALPELSDAVAHDLVGDERHEAVRVADLDLGGADLARSTFAECLFERVGLHETDLRGAHLVESRLTQVDAPVLTAPRGSWRQVVIERSRLGAVETYESTWRSLLVGDCKLGYLNARSSRWQDVTLRGCRVDELDLSGARLTRVAFEDCRIGRCAPRVPRSWTSTSGRPGWRWSTDWPGWPGHGERAAADRAGATARRPPGDPRRLRPQCPPGRAARAVGLGSKVERTGSSRARAGRTARARASQAQPEVDVHPGRLVELGLAGEKP